jgi:hypothetical protein
MKKTVLFLLLLATLAEANYNFYYRGFKIAEVDTLETIHKTYVKAKVTNPIYRLITGEPNVVYYHDYKPEFKDTKYRRDWQMYFSVLRVLIEERPKYQELLINDENHAFIVCEGNKCSFKYYEIDKPIGNGIVTFDDNNEVVSIVDNVNHAELLKQ